MGTAQSGFHLIFMSRLKAAELNQTNSVGLDDGLHLPAF